MSARVGQDIESICGKCGDTWHVVVACVGTQIAKVVCKQCGGQHRYRPPGGRAQRVPRRQASPTGPTSRRSQTGVPMIEADPRRPVRSYAASESFSPGDRITHKTFGEGLVEAIAGPGKIQVFFRTGRKVLVHEVGG